MRTLAVRLPALLLGAITAAYGATPFFLFDAAPIDPGVFPVLERYFQNMDFVGARLLDADANLRQKTDRAHQVELANGLDMVQAVVNKGCGAGSPGTIWYLSPPVGTAEAANPIGSIESAVRAIHASGCHQAGVIPTAQFWGYSAACYYDLAASPYQQVDWTQVDRLNIQGESFLKVGCKTGVTDYQKLVATVASYVRAKNPNIVVLAHVTFRVTPPAMMIQAITAMAGSVDGFLLAYPLYSEHLYCTAENLETVLKAFRPASGAF